MPPRGYVLTTMQHPAATKLFFSLGISPLSPTRYALEGDSARATREPTPFATLAIQELHDAFIAGDAPENRITQAIPLLTRAAAAHANWGAVKAALEARKITVQPHRLVPEGTTLADFADLVALIAEHVEDHDRLVFDITNAMRHIPLMMMLAVAFVRTVRRDVELVFMGYGAWELAQDGCAPLTDLSPALHLVDWAQALHRFSHLGATGPLQVLTRDLSPGLAKALGRFEDGWRTWRFEAAQDAARDIVRCLDALQFGPPTGGLSFVTLGELAAPLRRELAPWLEPREPGSLLAQAWFTDWLLSRRLWVQALTLMTELLIAQEAAALPRAAATSSLEHHLGARAALDTVIHTRPASDLTTRERAYGRLKPLRNSVLHGGLARDAGPPDAETLRGLLAEVTATMRDLGLLGPPPGAAPGASGRVSMCCAMGTGPKDRADSTGKTFRAYERLDYRWPGGALQTRFTPLASRHRFQTQPGGANVTAARVLASEVARRQPMFRELREEWPELEPCEVVSQGAQGDLASAFAGVWSYLEPGDRVVLDFTHALRSTSFGMVAAAVLARTTKPGLNIALVTYGVEPTQEARRAALEDGMVPVASLVDLEPMVALLDWADAVDAFLHGGEAGLLVARLRAATIPALRDLGDAFDQFAVATSTFRHRAAIEAARRVLVRLEAIGESRELANEVPSFRVIQPLLTGAVRDLAKTSLDDRLGCMRSMAAWLAAREAYVPSLGVHNEIAGLTFAASLGLYPPGESAESLGENDLAVVSLVAARWSRVAAARKREAKRARKGKAKQKASAPVHPLHELDFKGASPSLEAHIRSLDPEGAVGCLLAATGLEAELERSACIGDLRNLLLHAGHARTGFTGAPPETLMGKLVSLIQAPLPGSSG